MSSDQRCCSVCVAKPSHESVLKQCGGCQVLLYCGIICQKEHWKKVHRKHCKKITCKEDLHKDELSSEFKKMLDEAKKFNTKEVVAVQNPLKDAEDFLDDKLKELANMSSALNSNKDGGVSITLMRLRVKY